MSSDQVTQSSGNVFADLGFEDPEEELLKANLSRQLRAVLTESGLGETEAGQILALPQADLSAIITGRTGSFSIELLVRCLDRLDYRVDVKIHRKQRSATTALA